MIFENNYAWPGVTTILYNFEIDYQPLGFYVTPPIGSNNYDSILLPEFSTLCEIGIKYKKESEDTWNYIKLCNNTQLERVKHGISMNAIGIAKISGDSHLIASPTGHHIGNYMSPIRVAIRNLEQNTTYNIKSYYKISSNTTEFTFNSCSATTMVRQNIYYNCTEVTGASDDKYNEELRNRINIACGIYNEMTAFTRESIYASDNLKSKNGGDFTAVYDPLLYQEGAAARSDMHFATYYAATGTIVHEMAHNLMKPETDETENEESYNKIVKFMEFATHSPEASWRWNNSHNYPVISSAGYEGVHNYLVAAACYVARSTVEGGI